MLGCLVGSIDYLLNGYGCKIKSLKIPNSFIDELNYNCLLIYTKKNHYSNDLLSEQVKRYKKS